MYLNIKSAISVVNNNEAMLQKYFVPHQNLLLTGLLVSAGTE